MGWFLVNFCTALRIPFSLVAVHYALLGEWKTAMAWFLAAVLTDLLDGLLALIFKVRSKFGELFDPSCDTIMVIAGGIGLVMTTGERYHPWLIFLGIFAATITYVAVLGLPGLAKKRFGWFGETLFYKILSFCYPLSYVAVAVGILCIYIVRGMNEGAPWGLLAVAITMIFVALMKRGRVAEWYSPVKEHLAR